MVHLLSPGECCCGSFDCAEQSGAITESWPGGGTIEDWTLFFAVRNPQIGQPHLKPCKQRSKTQRKIRSSHLW